MGQGILGEGSAQAEAQRQSLGLFRALLRVPRSAKRPVGGADPQKDSHRGISRILRQSRILAHNWAPVFSSEALDMGLPKMYPPPYSPSNQELAKNMGRGRGTLWTSRASGGRQSPVLLPTYWPCDQGPACNFYEPASSQ